MWKLYENKGVHVQEWLAEHRAIAVIASICLLIATVIIRMYAIIPHWSGMRIDGVIACAIALCVVTILRRFPCVMSALSFLGKHSMNIYMTHTFFISFWYVGWLNNCEWLRGGELAILLTICVIISMGLEYLKDKIGIYKLMKIIAD